MLIGSPLGWSTYVWHSHGAYELAGDLAPVMKLISIALQLIFLSAIAIWSLLLGQRYSRRVAYCVSLLILAADIMLSNVLSLQYFIWAIPLALLLAVEIMSDAFAARWIFMGLLVIVVTLTTWIFPYHYLSGSEESYALVVLPLDGVRTVPEGAAIVLIVRNFTYVGIMIWLAVVMARTFKKRARES
jgi:hypothetical protein